MMTITISADDPRSIKAIEIAAGAASWVHATSRDGRQLIGVPSQCKAGTYYLVDAQRQTCECQDFQRHGLSQPRIGQNGMHGLCKHVRGVLLYFELVRAQQKPQRRARGRGHLSVVRPEGDER